MFDCERGWQIISAACNAGADCYLRRVAGQFSSARAKALLLILGLCWSGHFTLSAQTKAKAPSGPEAQYQEALKWLNGENSDPKIKDNAAEAVRLLKEAAKTYHPAQHALATCYAAGIGMKQSSLRDAITWYQRAAKEGNIPEAKYKLAYLIRRGQPGAKKTAKADEEAFKLYEDAARQGLPEAQFELAKCYYEGRGVPQEYAPAGKWYLDAANGGHAEAQFELAMFMRIQRNQFPDQKIEMAKWFIISANRGNDAAAKRVEEIRKSTSPTDRMSPQEMAEAEKRAREYVPRH
jgi:TPR repeat protein